MKRFIFIAMTVSLVSSAGKANDLGHSRPYAFENLAECRGAIKTLSEVLKVAQTERDQALIESAASLEEYSEMVNQLMDVESMLAEAVAQKKELKSKYAILLEALQEIGITVDPDFLNVD
jgi:hypothetical protein